MISAEELIELIESMGLKQKVRIHQILQDAYDLNESIEESERERQEREERLARRIPCMKCGVTLIDPENRICSSCYKEMKKKRTN